MNRSRNSFADMRVILSQIENATLAPKDARKALSDLLQSGPKGEIGEHIFEALRIATGRILRDRIASADLRAWHSLVDAVSAQFDEVNKAWGPRIEVLAELLNDRVGLVEARPVEQVVRRLHVSELLEEMSRTDGAPIERRALRERLGLEEANLSRVLTLMLDSGLIERHSLGKSASFSLASEGQKALQELKQRRASYVVIEGDWMLKFMKKKTLHGGAEGNEAYAETAEIDETLSLLEAA
ncbi:hypothetical protein [Novosphingopyxis sp.]|uniref:hypothetical protein n=1 Tax=Novosphingopyxis sp. TaxID=2709690 RepID=UPI003B5A9292